MILVYQIRFTLANGTDMLPDSSEFGRTREFSRLPLPLNSTEARLKIGPN